MKFVLFVEGPTEKIALPGFLKRWLDPRLNSPVGVQAVCFEGCAELIKDSPVKTRLHLQKGDVIAVIALLDLHGPLVYPRDKKSASERYLWAKKDLEAKVGDPRFRQFFAVHETEAWLFSSPDIFPPDVREAIAGRAKNPEGIDFDQPPSKLLDRVYEEKTRHAYKKVVDGKDLFDKLDPSVAYAKCPRLKELLDEMLKMAKAKEI